MGRNQFQVLSRERIFFFHCYSAAEFIPVHVESVMFYPVPLQTLINYSWQSASLRVSAARSDTTQSRSTFVGHVELVCLLDLKINSCFEMQIPMCTKDLWKREYPFFLLVPLRSCVYPTIRWFLWWNCHHLWCRLFTCETFGIKNNVKSKILHHYRTHGIWIIDKKCL